MTPILVSLWWLWIWTYSFYIGIDSVMTWPRCQEMAEAYNKAFPSQHPAFCAPAHKPHRDYIPHDSGYYEEAQP